MNKYFHLINLLSKKELTEFEAYLAFKPFNSNGALTNLYYYCKTLNNKPSFDKKKLLNKIGVNFSTKSLNAKVNKLFFQLSGLVEKYLRIKVLDIDSDLNDVSLIKALAYKGEIKYLRKYLTNKINELDEIDNKGEEQYVLLLYMNYINAVCFDLFFELSYLNKQFTTLKQLNAHNEIIRLFVEFMHNPGIVKQQLQSKDETLANLKARLDDSNLFKVIMISLLSDFINTTTSLEKFKDYNELIVKMLNDNETPQFVLFDLVDSMLHYVRFEHDKDIVKSVSVVQFELLKKAVVKNIFGVNHGYISRVIFNNIVLAACKQKKFKWAKTFINDYEKQHHPVFKNESILYLKAQVSYWENDFSNCLNYINQKVKFVDIIEELGVRTLLCICYYELGYYELLESKIDANIKHLKRSKKLPNYIKNGSLLFMTLLQNILYKKKNSSEKLTKAQNINFYYKSWIMKKLK